MKHVRDISVVGDDPEMYTDQLDKESEESLKNEAGELEEWNPHRLLS